MGFNGDLFTGVMNAHVFEDVHDASPHAYTCANFAKLLRRFVYHHVQFISLLEREMGESCSCNTTPTINRLAETGKTSNFD